MQASRAREDYLLSALSDTQREHLETMMNALLIKTRELNSLG
ncbi:MAG: hypothetical protein AB8G16_02770 [Gammaproteobacteria bacterium]